MRDAGIRWLVGLMLVLVPVVLVTAGCTRTVTGTPSAAPPHAFPATPTAAAGSVTVGGPDPPAAPAPEPGPAGLEPDVLADECLLDARQLTALLGRPVGRPEQSVVRRDDGSRSSSCYAGAVQGPPVPLVAINVYRVRDGSPATFVAAAGGRALAGVGPGATVLDTPAGPTLQAAGGRYLVTLVVQGREPDEGAWRTAARQALARLPG